MRKTNCLKLALLSLSLGLLTACQSGAPQQIALTYASKSLGCMHQKTALFDYVREELINSENKKIPDAERLTQKFMTALEKEGTASGSKDQEKTIRTLFHYWLTELPKKINIKDSTQLLLALSAMDAENTYEPWMLEAKKQSDQIYSEFKNTTAKNTCRDRNSEKAEIQSKISGLATPIALKEGANFVLANTYQSCHSAQLPPLIAQSEDVRGIEIVGTHSDGVGKKRIIGNLSEVQASHYYIRDESYSDTQCFDVKASPLIYDYGGKPYASTSLSSNLNFFKNAGDGTKALGYDCSGFVFSILASSGKRLSPGRTLKAADVYSFGSTSYVNPQSNGLKCLDRIQVGTINDLAPGDIAAVPGHVLMIESVENDPFGYSNFPSKVDCTKVNIADFHFTVIQSSNSKLGIGINKFDARDYLATSEKMKVGFLSYAKASCENYFSNKKTKFIQNGFSIIRHSGTSDCLASRVSLERESCVKACAPQLILKK